MCGHTHKFITTKRYRAGSAKAKDMGGSPRESRHKLLEAFSQWSHISCAWFPELQAVTTRVKCRQSGKLLRDSGPGVSIGAGRAGTLYLTRTLERFPASNSWTPARCPAVGRNSDTVYPEAESHSTGKGLRPPSTLHFRCQSQVQAVTRASDQLVVNRRFPCPPPLV